MRLAGSRKTKGMLDPPFREGGKFVQEAASLSVHGMTLLLDSRNITDHIVGELARESGFDLS